MSRFRNLILAVLPLICVFLLSRAYPDSFEFVDVIAARLSFSWPLAVHPDDEALQSAQSEIQAPLRGPQEPVHFQQHQPQHKPIAHHHAELSSAVKPIFTRRIVAVGDLHGDMPNAQKVLEMAGVVDTHGHWTGGVDVFVQTGDIIDRGDDTIKLYSFMDQLRQQAIAKGGVVMSHLGNHEWMNVIGDWRYVRPSEIQTFGSVAARQKMLSTGRIGRSWAANYTTTSRLPLHPSLGPPNTDYDPTHKSVLAHAAISFVHGGLAPTYPDLTPFPSRINQIGTSLLRKLQSRAPPPPHPPHPYPGLPKDATVSENRLYGNDGPLWYRGWALDPEEQVCAAVDAVLQKTGTRRMVMGHTPDFEKIVSRCNGKIIIIDTGISHAYGGALSALSVHYTLTPVVSKKSDENDATKPKIFKEKEIVTALYMDRTEILAEDEREVQGDFA